MTIGVGTSRSRIDGQSRQVALWAKWKPLSACSFAATEFNTPVNMNFFGVFLFETLQIGHKPFTRPQPPAK